ncbi:ATPase [Candidatus Thorarchaeota archaeon]|nr:MAG: ATPase [Candidatus Thorarchaeota archaeon]
MNRVKTGIIGFDPLVDGGLVRGSTTLVSGRTGTGKTVFGLQFLYYGAVKYDEPGVYVTLETLPGLLRTQAKGFGWDLKTLENDGKIVIIDAASSKAGLGTSERIALKRGFDMTTLAEEIYRAVDEYGAKRLVIDCLSGLGLRFSEPSEVRRELHRISSLLNEMEVTSIFLSEALGTNGQSRADVEQFITQGLVVLSLAEQDGELQRSLLVWKMEGTSHSMKRHPFEISQKGLRILKDT